MKTAVAFLSLLVLWPAPGWTGEPRTAAVFDFELIDNSLEGEKRGVDPAETRRLRLISDLLREKLAASGQYRIVPTAPAAADIEEAGYIHSCNGCDVRIARKLGAQLAVSGHVFKVSTLILNITIVERDAQSGKLLRQVNADIRGNTDQSWSHGVRWLVRNRLTAE